MTDQREAAAVMLEALERIASIPTWNECMRAEPQLRKTKADISNELDHSIDIARAAIGQSPGA